MNPPRTAAALFGLAFALCLSLLVPAPAAEAAPGGAFRVLVDAGHGGGDPGALSDLPRLVEKDVTEGVDPGETFYRVWSLASGRKPGVPVPTLPPDRLRAPRLSEPWFC